MKDVRVTGKSRHTGSLVLKSSSDSCLVSNSDSCESVGCLMLGGLWHESG